MKKFMVGIATAALAMTLSAMSLAQQDQSAPSNSQSSSAVQNGQQTSPEQQGTQPSAQSPDSSTSMQNSQGMQNAVGSSFTGTVVKAGGKYVLQTADSNYQLDDQDKAASGRAERKAGLADRGVCPCRLCSLSRGRRPGATDQALEV